jgi:hypothetical protein
MSSDITSTDNKCDLTVQQIQKDYPERKVGDKCPCCPFVIGLHSNVVPRQFVQEKALSPPIVPAGKFTFKSYLSPTMKYQYAFDILFDTMSLYFVF